MGITDGVLRVSTAAMYLFNNALLWWPCRYDDKSGEPVTTWELFVKEFRRQYYPAYVEEEAWDELCCLEQKGGLSGTIREY